MQVCLLFIAATVVIVRMVITKDHIGIVKFLVFLPAVFCGLKAFLRKHQEVIPYYVKRVLKGVSQLYSHAVM